MTDSLVEQRRRLVADTTATGPEWCRRWSDAVDDWLALVFQRATGSVGAKGVALAAVGGYGRAELCPHSDIDVVLLHAGRADIGEVADRVWYPVWDSGLKLGHAVRTTREALALAADDLDTATSLLSVRHLAGDAVLTAELAVAAGEHWRKRSRRWLRELCRSVEDRHRRAGEVAFLLEPDLKEGRGGLRDVHALAWADAARQILFGGDRPGLDRAYRLLLAVRVELHRRTGRAGDRLVLQEQDGIADALGYGDADALMADVADAARTIAWTSDDTWSRVRSALAGPLGRLAHRDRPVAPGVVLRDGEIHLAVDADPRSDPVLVLRAAAAASGHGTIIDRASLERLAAEAPPLPDPWPAEARGRFVDLLRSGRAAIPVVEALDQRGLWVRVLPEWEPVRSRPQRNAYHRFTVDRHLVETAANAAEIADRVGRADLLVIAALLHDIGKAHPGDHTDAGVRLVGPIVRRMGFPPDDVATVVALVEHHLLLPDVATRRDLDDPDTVEAVAKAVDRREVLHLLDALTEADCRATGASAWTPWKAELIGELVGRVGHVLGGGEAAEVVGEQFPSAEQQAMMAAGQQVIDGRGDRLTVIARDRPGLFARVAGTLALHGLGVLAAAAHSADGMAIAEFRVEATFGPVVSWERVRVDLERALSGKLALLARVDERAQRYTGRAPAAAEPAVTRVSVDNSVSAAATVVDVLAPDAVGVLYQITRALADLDLDIRSARVQTLGHQGVDSFYVCEGDGAKVTDEAHLAEIQRALLHALDG